MTPGNFNEQMVQEAKPARAWDEAAALGIDMSLLELSLGRTPAERFREHSRALRFAWELREAMKKRNEHA